LNVPAGFHILEVKFAITQARWERAGQVFHPGGIRHGWKISECGIVADLHARHFAINARGGRADDCRAGAAGSEHHG
jgi:hypothetical protein